MIIIVIQSCEYEIFYTSHLAKQKRGYKQCTSISNFLIRRFGGGLYISNYSLFGSLGCKTLIPVVSFRTPSSSRIVKDRQSERRSDVLEIVNAFLCKIFLDNLPYQVRDLDGGLL